MAQEIIQPLLPGSRAGGAGAAAWPPAQLGRLFASARDCAARRAERLTVAVTLMVALLHLLRVYDRGLNLLDEGYVLHVAERVLQGQVPYRDFFTQLTPGAFLALAGVFALTGPSVMVGRWVTVALGLLITFLLYSGARRLVLRPTAALAALAFPVWGIGQGWFYPNYSWFALAAAMGALVCLLKACSSTAYATCAPRSFKGSGGQAGPGGQPRRRAHGLWPDASWAVWPATAGFLAGLSAFCKQNMGLYVLVALVCAMLVAGPGDWRSRLHRASVIVVAALPIPFGLLAWLAANDALVPFYRDAIFIPFFIFPREMAAPYPAIWPPWPVSSDPPGQGAWYFRVVCLLPPLPLALGLAGLLVTAPWRRRIIAPDRHAARVSWLTVALAVWATAFPRADFDHVQVALGPAFIIGAAMVESAGRLAVRARVWRLWGAADQVCAVRDLTPYAARYAPVLRAANAAGAPGLAWGARLRLLLQRIDGEWCRNWLPQTLAGGVLAGFLVAGLAHARGLDMGPRASLRTLDDVAPRAAGILLDKDDAAELYRLISEVRRLSSPGEAIVSIPWNAGLYFLAERQNATRFDLFIPASVLPPDLPEIEAALDDVKLIVYWTARDSFVANTSLSDRIPSLHDYVMSRCCMVGSINAYRLMLRE